MGTIRRANPRLDAAAARAPRANPGLAFAGGDLGAFGDAIDELTEVVDEVRERNQLEADTAFATEKASELRRRATEIRAAARGEMAGDPTGHTDRVIRSFENEATALALEAPSERAGRFLLDRATAIGDGLHSRASSDELVELQAYQIGSLTKAQKELELSVFNDPSQLPEALDQGLEDITAAEAGFLSPGSADEQRAVLPTRLAAQAMLGRIAAEPQASLDALRPKTGEQDPVVALLDVDARSALIQVAERAVDDQARAVARREAEDAAQLKAVQAQRGALLDIAVSRGQANHQDVTAAFQRGDITPAKMASLTKDVDKIQVAELEQAEERRRVAAARRGIGFLDPQSKADRDAVDNAFARDIAPLLADMPPGQAEEAVAQFISEVGMVPPTLRAQFRGALRSGTPEQKLAAADAVARVGEVAPGAVKDFGSVEVALAEQINTLIGRGVEPTQAVARAEDLVFNADEPARVVRRARLSEQGLLATYTANFRNKNEIIKLELDTSGAVPLPAFFTPDVGDALIGEYRQAFAMAYERTGDDETADRIARRELKGVWATSRVTGDTFMKFAPERYGLTAMSDRENADWMREQLRGEVGDRGAGDRLKLVADRLTAREASNPGQAPSYAIMLLNADGGYEPIMAADGSPERYRPTWSTSPAAARSRRQAEAEEAEAAERAKRLRLNPMPEVLN